MAIATYTDLQDAISEYLAREDLAGSAENFIALAEARMNRVLRTRDMEVSAPVMMTSGSGPLPSDYLEWISATWNGAQDLRYVEPDSEEWRFRYRPGGDPSQFTIVANTIQIRPVVAGDVTLVYYKTIPALVSSTTNWLLTKSPDLYLNYALAEAYIRIKDMAKAKDFMSLASQELQNAVGDADSNKVSRRPARAAEIDDIAASRNPATSGR